MRSARGEDGTRGAVAWIVAAWFVAAIAVSFKGERFVMLAVAPFGLALAAAAGELYHLLHGLIKRAVRAPARLGQAGAFILAAAPLAIPVCNGYAAARNYVPEMNGAWWNTLARIREESPTDAIIDTWWDYGYWAEYVAGRRVAADGGAVRTHIPLWIAKALMAPSERQAARLLRMLNCGSDATPDAAGRQGAFGKLRAYGIGEVEAAETVAALAGLDRQTASDYLERRGLSGPARDDVLASTHCTPPPSYLVLSTAMNSISGWRYLGNWDLRRAGPQGSGSAGYAAPYWIPCAPSQGPEEMCFMGFDAYAAGSAHPEAVIVNARDPARTRLRMRDGSAMTAAHEIAPRAVLIAGPRAIEELRCTGRPCAELAVLIDPGKHRVLVGPPALIRSTYTRLMFLGGRYGRVFRKTGERRGYGGERVTAWRIDWDRLVYK
jgi:hypothetical protein